MLTPTVLMLAATRPDADALGGVPVHVDALATLGCRHGRVWTAHPEGGELLVEEWGPRRLVAALPLSGAADAGAAIEDALVAALAGTGASVLHVHSPELGPRAIARAARRSGAATVLTLHDHTLVCEQHLLLEGGIRYCDVPTDLARCDSCLARLWRKPAGAVLAHRARAGELVAATQRAIAPSRSVLEIAERVHPALASRTVVVPWGVPAPTARRPPRASRVGPLRLAVVGVHAHAKGAGRLPALIEACRQEDVEWHLFGATEGASLRDVRRSARRVVAHGAYRRAELAPGLVRAGVDAVLIPSLFPESFCLALAEVCAAGFPVVASDLGALGERTRAEGLGWTFDPWEPATLVRVLESLQVGDSELESVAARLARRPLRTEADMARDHGEVWAEAASAGAARADAPVDPAALGRYAEGARRAGARRPSVVAALVGRIRRTPWYRDLPLRRLLPERTRKSVEETMKRLRGPRG